MNIRHFIDENGKAYDVPENEVEEFMQSAGSSGMNVKEENQQVNKIRNFSDSSGKIYDVPENEVNEFMQSANASGMKVREIVQDKKLNRSFRDEDGKEYDVPEDEVDEFLQSAESSGKKVNEIKSLGIFGTIKKNQEAQFGEMSTGELLYSMIPIFGKAEQTRQEMNERALFNGDYKNTLEGGKIAAAAGVPQEVIDRIYEETGSGGRNRFGGWNQHDIELFKEKMKAVIEPVLKKRIESRESAQRDLQNNDLNIAQKIAVGLSGAGELATMTSGAVAAATLPGAAITRGARNSMPGLTLDENGNIVQISEGDSEAKSIAKGIAGAAAERFIWMGLGKVVKAGGDKLLKKFPGVDKALGSVAGKPMQWSAAAAKKLSESEGGRLILKTGDILGKIENTVHLGSLPAMMVKSRLTELTDDVIGLNVAGDQEGEKFSDWLSKFVSVKDNFDLMVNLIGIHAAMSGIAAIRARGANRSFRKNAREILGDYLGEEQLSKLSNEDAAMLVKMMTSKGLTAERAEKFLNDVRSDLAAAEQKISEGASYTELAKAYETIRKGSREAVAAGEGIVEKLKTDEQRAAEEIVRRHQEALRAAEAERAAVEAEKERKRAEDSAFRGASTPEQIVGLESREIKSWEDAAAQNLIRQDEQGRWTGGARQAINIHLNGTEKMKSAVKDGRLDGDLAEELLSLSYCELGDKPKAERDAFVDRIIDQADGNPETARELMAELTGYRATAEQPQTALEGAENAARMKGTELRSTDGALMGCTRFPEVKVAVNSEGIFTEGLTDRLMSDPRNAADVAALLTRLDAIAEKTGLRVHFGGDENAAKVAGDIAAAVQEQGLAKIQRRMDVRTRLFDILAKTTLDAGTTFTEAEFKKALAETGNGRRYIDNHGRIYGFKSADGTLHFNPAAINFNTPIHEYGHLALEAVKKINPALWKKGMELIRKHSYYEDIRKQSEDPNHEYSYLKGREEDIADEALTTLIGDRGERIVEKTGLGAELKAWLKDFWKAFKNAFGVADLSEDQIENMTIGEFVDAMNAELLRGREFGTKKQQPLEKKSIRRYDEDQGSGSNGMLRWKNDRGYLFAIPVDMERTQPGGRVVLSRDDANITDWIQNRLNGYTLRLSKSGNIYVEGQNGLPKELAEIFGRFPTIGHNDGIYGEIENATGRPLNTVTPDHLVEMLASDRANYDAWREGRNAEADHYRLEAERDAAEAQQRWENSGMNVLDYIRSRAEEGAPDFDLDWETAREIARDQEKGKFHLNAQFHVAKIGTENVAVALDTPLSAKEAKDPKKVEAVLRPFVGKEFSQFGEGKIVKVSEEFVKEFVRGKYGQKMRRLNGNEAKKANRDRVSAATVMDDILSVTPLGTEEQPKHINQLFKDGATFYRNKTKFGVVADGTVRVYPCDLLVLQTKSGDRYIYDFVNVGTPTLAAKDALDSTTSGLVNARTRTVGSGPTADSLSNFSATGNEVTNAKLSTSRESQYAQPSLFDQVYQPTFDFNRQAELPKQTELDFTSENAKPAVENAKPKLENEKRLIGTDRIEDVGVKISGARKDILKNYVKAINDATREQLYTLPFSKAFKKPDLVKAVQSGVMRDSDARFYETILSTIVQKKPILTAKEERLKKYRPGYMTNLDKWVENTHNALSILKRFLEQDEGKRDQFIQTVLGNKHINVEADNKRLDEIRRLNPGREIASSECYTPNPIYVASEVLKKIGHEIGDKIDIPYAIAPNTVFSRYNLVDGKGNELYKFQSDNLETAIENLAYLTKVKRGDTDLEHPDQAFTIGSGRNVIAENGQFRVYWGKGSGVENQKDFPTREQAEAFAKSKPSSLHPMTYPVKAIVGRTDYSVRFVHPLTGEVTLIGNKVFETKEEAQRYFDENREEINDLANSVLAKDSGKQKSEMTADKLVRVGYMRSSENHWVVYEQGKDDQTVIRSFKTQEEANKYRDEIKADYLEQWKKNKEARKQFVYFDTGDQKRIGEDYRQGKDVTAEDFMNEFGFRGVQFGNWTNQADRQMAVNQAYDAFMDLSNLIGIPPKALSLNGELGIAFGARGSGSALAHYEPNEVVINLTKTKGAGSLAHEWWHALDNYFARAAGAKGGMVTDSERLAMRTELRDAFNAFTRNMDGSNYGIRSRKQGAYWGRMHEITARFLAEWVDQSLKKQGRLNTFLSRGANEEGWLEFNYGLYKAQRQAAKAEPVSIEEFEKNPIAYQGFPFPTKKEVAEFGENVRRIFDTIKIREEGEGANTTYALFSVGDRSSGNAPRMTGRNFIAGRAMVAEDYGRGEQTPGALAASRELDQTHAAPISMTGQIRRMSLPLSELEVLRKILTGDNLPAHIVKRLPGGKSSAHTKAGRIFLAADIVGTIDKTDASNEKATLKQHGFFMNEDPAWCSAHSPNEIRNEKRRSEEQLADRLLRLSSMRANGVWPGGHSAARQVFADELAAIVMDLPQQATTSVLGTVQKIGKGLRAELKNLLVASGTRSSDAEAAMRGEAEPFLDWAYGGRGTRPDGQPIDAYTMNELTGKMFGAWLVMPKEVENRAPQWSKAIETTIANTPALADAFRKLTIRGMSEQATSELQQRIIRQQSLQTERALSEIRAERYEPIGTGSRRTDAKERFLVAFHDKFAPVYLRIDEKVKSYLAAKRAALKQATSPAARAQIQQQIDLFMGDIGQKLHKLELSRTAYERGSWNEGRRYFIQMVTLENKASEKWGLSEQDRSTYLDLQRIIETQGRSASDGIDPRQAAIMLENMARRLGTQKWQLMRQYGDEFFSIHEHEVLDDPRLERMLGKGIVDYFRTQSHYVATKRTWSEEEIAEIDAARKDARRNGVAGGDDVVSQMYAYADKKGAGQMIGEALWTGNLTGSMAAKQEVRSATWEKVDPLMQAVRRNQEILDLRDALLAAEVTGVRDLRRTDGSDYPNSARYGHLNYMENGEKKTLVVPRQIADAFKTTPDLFPKLTKFNGLVRKAFIDWNVAYTPQNIKRNQASLEANMPGMRETYLKTALRATVPGAAPLVDLATQFLVRKIPSLGNIFGKHTVFFHLPKAERWAKIVEDPSSWQQQLWDAESRGDVAAVTRLQEDFAGVMEMLKGNFLIPTGQAYGDRVTEHGFAFDAMRRKGLKTLEMAQKEVQARSKFGKFVDAVNIFKKNQALNEHEDVLAKTIGYLHDRMFNALQRSPAESGLTVKRNVSIAEGERSGTLKRGIQQVMAQFYNMVEKGVVRHWRNFGERPGEMLVKDGKVWIGRALGGLLAYGALQKFLLDDAGGDEEKAREKYGKLYDYAAACHRGYQNCSQYVRDNYSFTPVWTSDDGYTTLIMGGAMTDEEKLVVPTADLFAKWIAWNLGIGEKPELGETIAKSTFKAVAPDLQLAAPAVTMLRDTIEAMFVDNPTDYFRNAPTYDPNLWELRNESWEMRGKFAAAMGARLWNDLGGRALIQPDINGVDNGRGQAPESIETILRKIPVVSPAIGRLFKIQVGSPEKLGAPITEEANRKRAIINVCSKSLFNARQGDRYLHEADPQEYERRLARWAETYELSPIDVQKIRQKYLNAMLQHRNRAALDQKKLMQLRKEAMRQGRDEADVWLMLGDM